MDMKVGRALMLLALTSLALMFSNVETSKASSTTISIQPSTTTVSVCQNFTVDICIENVIGLFGWQARLSWDPSLLEVVEVAEGDFLPSESKLYYWTNQSEGWIFVFSPWQLWASHGVTGSGTLANVTFHCTGSGECVLDLNETILIGYPPVLVPIPPYLGDVNGDMIVDATDMGIISFVMYDWICDQIYYPPADFNSDGCIDIYDLTCLYFNWAVVYLYQDDALQPVEIAHEVQDGYPNLEEPVGGTYIPVDKFSLLAPYIALFSTIILAVSISVAYIKHRKK